MYPSAAESMHPSYTTPTTTR
ncbi:hypothetical protein ACHAXN_004800 [Cyclotella atomus]